MSGIRIAALCLVLGACATAATPGSDDDGDDDGGNPSIDAPVNPDGNNPPDVDAPTVPIDAPVLPIDGPPAPTTVTLSQSSSTAVTELNTVACGAAGYTQENSYYRVFRLADHGINSAFTADRIDFAVEQADSLSGSQTIQVRVHTLNGAFVRSNLTTIAGQNVTVANQTLTNMSVNLSPPGVAPAGSTIVVEVFSPNGEPSNTIFYLGSNAAAETGPSYIRAPATGCVITEPATYASIGFPQVHLVMSVTGTY